MIIKILLRGGNIKELNMNDFQTINDIVNKSVRNSFDMSTFLWPLMLSSMFSSSSSFGTTSGTYTSKDVLGEKDFEDSSLSD